ncbi:unnamed protein product [Paramecium sonneborni]|uniref:CENP-V/GFA domain-containing protein n=1 Tax=Paramecium sonneborni TaxID=65129 RepID=A0A8S1NA59_9CILI|nr:unnamed protein product [Paramecium sonneborni]
MEQIYQGNCHCQKDQFEFLGPVEMEIIRCHCSICKMKQNHQVTDKYGRAQSLYIHYKKNIFDYLFLLRQTITFAKFLESNPFLSKIQSLHYSYYYILCSNTILCQISICDLRN